MIQAWNHLDPAPSVFGIHPTAQEILTAAIGPISKHEYPYLLPTSLCTLDASLAKKKKAGIPATVPTLPRPSLQSLEEPRLLVRRFKELAVALLLG